MNANQRFAIKNVAPIGEHPAPVHTAVGEENESFTNWPEFMDIWFRGTVYDKSLTDPAQLSPEPEGQSTTQQTTSDAPVDSQITKSCDVDDITTVDTPTGSMRTLFYVDISENGVRLSTWLR